MGVLKRKDERNETITIRIPASLKSELEQLRQRADAAGFNLGTTITESLTRLAKQIREELDSEQADTSSRRRLSRPNGLARGGGELSPAGSSSGNEG
jgi:uncharacterized protein YicC (UPF0701 family)